MVEDALEKTVEQIRPLDREAMEACRGRLDNLTKPQGSLGRLEDLVVRIAGITGNPAPSLRDKAVVVMAADHGVAREGTSAYPQEVTGQMVLNFLAGGAGINVLARPVGARVVVVDMGVAADLDSHPALIRKSAGQGTCSFAQGPAMTRAQAMACIMAGTEVLHAEAAKGLDMVGTGDMGIGNTACSAAICAAITGESPARVVGRGTGVDDEGLARKVAIVRRALEVNRPRPDDALDILTKVGGFEIGGLAGVVLAASARRIPVMLDGFNAGAAAMLACLIAPPVRDYLIAAHLSAEGGHKIMLDWLGLAPLLDLGMRLGEGTGAALGMYLAEVSTRVLTEMATFGEAGVSGEVDRR